VPKRFFDLVFSLLGLILLAPVGVLLYVAVRSDGGPAFFRQKRVGHKGKVFEIYKFRTMIVDAHRHGLQVTAGHDPRVTFIGRLLRRTKLDELPQLWNVVRGEMSLVGPRPEVPSYVQRWPLEDRNAVLSVRPGLTDYAALVYHDEEAVLARAEDPEKAYLKVVTPHKIHLYKRYIQDRSLWLDIRLVTATILKMAGIDPCVLLPEVRADKECQEG